jgi:hypothetical protein
LRNVSFEQPCPSVPTACPVVFKAQKHKLCCCHRNTVFLASPSLQCSCCQLQSPACCQLHSSAVPVAVPMPVSHWPALPAARSHPSSAYLTLQCALQSTALTMGGITCVITWLAEPHMDPLLPAPKFCSSHVHSPKLSHPIILHEADQVWGSGPLAPSRHRSQRAHAGMRRQLTELSKRLQRKSNPDRSESR